MKNPPFLGVFGPLLIFAFQALILQQLISMRTGMTKKLLTRRETANYLIGVGISSSHSTLARLAIKGIGPKYTIIGGRAYYTTEWIDDWVESQLIPHQGSYDRLLNGQK